MNLVRLSFIVGMTTFAVYALNLAVSRPYVPPVETTCTINFQLSKCLVGGGYYNEALYLLAFVALVAALAVACADLVRRIY